MSSDDVVDCCNQGFDYRFEFFIGSPVEPKWQEIGKFRPNSADFFKKKIEFFKVKLGKDKIQANPIFWNGLNFYWGTDRTGITKKSAGNQNLGSNLSSRQYVTNPYLDAVSFVWRRPVRSVLNLIYIDFYSSSFLVLVNCIGSFQYQSSF